MRGWRIFFLAWLGWMGWGLAQASEEPDLRRAPVNPGDYPSLQNGARIFANYCLSCHGAKYVRYSKLEKIGIPENVIKENLLFARARVGDAMAVALPPKDGKRWFGVAPPDLSSEARGRGPDWLYTFLLSFYRDPERPTGWNNLIFPAVSMPHTLSSLQGVYTLEKNGEHETLKQVKPGKLTPAEYEKTVGDLVNFLTWMAEPIKKERQTLGIYVLLFLGLFFIVAYGLKRVMWKDVH